MIKILNLYSGNGGNRKNWKNVNVTAVEQDQDIANEYQKLYPTDKIIVGDAHQYLLNHYEEFDFIWSSPPCPTHSRIRKMGVQKKLYKAKYPDMVLWQEITLLIHYAKCDWIIENVVPYYEPIIKPTFSLDRHSFWSNFYVRKKQFDRRETSHVDINGSSTIYGFNIKSCKLSDKRRILRNLVNPDVGSYILNSRKPYLNKSKTESRKYHQASILDFAAGF